MNALYGTILGDLAGQPYEFDKKYKKPFRIHNPDSHITDDTVLTLAGAYAIMNNFDLGLTYKEFARRYPDCGFGKGFKEWMVKDTDEIGDSFGNGCLMRMGPFMYTTTPLKGITASVMTSHFHEESLQACLRLYNLYNGHLPDVVKRPSRFRTFTAKAIESIPFVEEVFAYTKTTHQAIETAVRLGGDTDTHAAILGELCGFTYEDLTKEDRDYVESKLDPLLLRILKDFNA